MLSQAPKEKRWQGPTRVGVAELDMIGIKNYNPGAGLRVGKLQKDKGPRPVSCERHSGWYL